MRRRALVIVVFIAAGVGCTTITPPANPTDPVAVMVADYGKHTSLLLPDPADGMTEYAFGDFDYFVLRHNAWYDGLRALFFSGGSALGRRQIPIRPGQADAAKVVGCERLLVFNVSRARVEALRKSLDSRFDRHRDTEAYNPESHEYDVRDAERYSLTHNCNHVVAGWLRDLGCEVRGLEMTSNFRFAMDPEREANPLRAIPATPAHAGLR